MCLHVEEGSVNGMEALTARLCGNKVGSLKKNSS